MICFSAYNINDRRQGAAEYRSRNTQDRLWVGVVQVSCHDLKGNYTVANKTLGLKLLTQRSRKDIPLHKSFRKALPKPYKP